MIKAFIRQNHQAQLKKDMGLLSDHFPMALQALSKMTADPEMISNFAKRKLLENRNAEVNSESELMIQQTNWKDFIGKRVHAPAYIVFFQRELEEKGLQLTLDKFLPELITGMGSAAFHGLIRLAYALELNLESEIAHALAAWTCTYQYLGKLPASGPHDLASSYNAARETGLFENSVIKGENIIQRMVTVSKDPEFPKLVANLDRNRLELSGLAEAVVTLYMSSSGNFTALHAVTSTHALRVLLPYLNQTSKSLALAYYWQALLAAAITFKTPALDVPLDNELKMSWDEIFILACQSTDEHVLKLVYTCFEESKVYTGSDIYKKAAYKKAMSE